MRVILATPPEYRHLTTPAQVLGPPIGLLYIASYARHYVCLRNINPDKAVAEVRDGVCDMRGYRGVTDPGLKSAGIQALIHDVFIAYFIIH